MELILIGLVLVAIKLTMDYLQARYKKNYLKGMPVYNAEQYMEYTEIQTMKLRNERLKNIEDELFGFCPISLDEKILERSEIISDYLNKINNKDN